MRRSWASAAGARKMPNRHPDRLRRLALDPEEVRERLVRQVEAVGAAEVHAGHRRDELGDRRERQPAARRLAGGEVGVPRRPAEQPLAELARVRPIREVGRAAQDEVGAGPGGRIAGGEAVADEDRRRVVESVRRQRLLPARRQVVDRLVPLPEDRVADRGDRAGHDALRRRRQRGDGHVAAPVQAEVGVVGELPELRHRRLHRLAERVGVDRRPSRRRARGARRRSARSRSRPTSPGAARSPRPAA